jgi:hypothetical protein
MGSSEIGRTDEERDAHRVEGGRDVGGDDRLRVDEREEIDEATDDARVREEDGGGVASLESEERARFALR